MGETYVWVQGRPRYLYRPIDRDSTLVDSLPSEQWDVDAARRFSVQAIEVVGHRSGQVTTDMRKQRGDPVL